MTGPEFFRRSMSVFAAMSCCLSGIGLAQPPQQASPVVGAPVVSQEIHSGQTFVGTVMPSKVATVGSAVAGRVVEFNINEGDFVKAQQPLAQLLTETIKLELVAAEAELEYRKSQLEELQNGSRKEEIDRAKAIMLAAQARSEYLASRRQRMQTLFASKGAATEESRDEAVSLAIEAEQSYLEAKADYELAVAGPRREHIAQAVAQVAIQQAIVDKLNDQIRKYTVISRFDGFVLEEHTEIGQWMNVGDPVATIAAMDKVHVQAYVQEEHIPYITTGVTARVEIPTLPDRVFTGTVLPVAPQADLRARTFPVKVELANEITADTALLKSGFYARVTLPAGEKKTALLVPKDALVLGGPQPLVFVVDGLTPTKREGTVRPVPVRPGVAVGQLIQVDGELTADQIVVVRGNERVRPGQPVLVTELRTIDSGAAEAE